MDFAFEAERASPFFSWFQLEEIAEPTPIDGGGEWRCFRPNGPAFRRLVEVDAEISDAGAVKSACIGLARAFIDDKRNGAFARDIAKSFLLWALRPPSPEASVLIDNISSLAGLPVIMRSPGPKPPVCDRSGGYEVFLGAGAGANLAADGLSLRNFGDAFPAERVHRFIDRGRLRALAEGLLRLVRTAPTPGDAQSGAGSGWLLIDAAPR